MNKELVHIVLSVEDAELVADALHNEINKNKLNHPNALLSCYLQAKQGAEEARERRVEE